MSPWMAFPMVEIAAPRLRLAVADALTASRVVVAVLLVASPASGQVVALVLYAWLSDAVDGMLARSVGRTGRMGDYDHLVDAAVGSAVVFYLGEVGLIPALATRVAVVVLLVLWGLTGIESVQMLLLALGYGALLWWAITSRPAGWWSLPLAVIVLLGVYWRRLATELVPTFLGGWSDLVRPRAR